MNRHITNFLFVLLFLITMCIRGFSQQQIEATLNNYYNNYAPERLHFHLDREVYAAGDTVWFKVYVMQGFSGSQQSKNLYVDWIDDNAKILAHQIYPITESGVAAGLFALPSDFKGTVLHLHAYTKWMLNFDSTFLYNRDIRIVQQFNSSGKSNNAVRQPKSSDAVSTSASSQISSSIIPALTFFPEGGNMVAGISNRIAFLCCDPWGRPVNIAGEIKDSKGNKVADFQTKHDGMGVSNLLPYSGETYTAEWKDERGNVHQTALPSIMQDGIVLKIDDAGENKRFVIQRSDNATDNLKQLHIVATMQQRLVYMANVNLNNATGTTGFIPETSLPAGGMTVTVFDNNWQPIAERLCFVDNLQQSRFPVQITWEKKSLDKRGYNQLLLTLPDSVPANLSLSITDMGLPKDSINNNNIFSELLLTGDIRGRVYNPDYYFSDTTDEVKHNLDLVMMTHGWRKYDWSKIVKG
ncbi:MAG: hypothetical protein LBE82_12880, partial [Chitinophagaceae bacterium]|nr:hypothetical protein [Chitinophagaceae bacterium]